MSGAYTSTFRRDGNQERGTRTAKKQLNQATKQDDCD
jgi:hypothetical protein